MLYSVHRTTSLRFERRKKNEMMNKIDMSCPWCWWHYNRKKKKKTLKNTVFVPYMSSPFFFRVTTSTHIPVQISVLRRCDVSYSTSIKGSIKDDCLFLATYSWPLLSCVRVHSWTCTVTIVFLWPRDRHVQKNKTLSGYSLVQRLFYTVNDSMSACWATRAGTIEAPRIISRLWFRPCSGLS